MVYFDDVLIPWSQVQHIGNPDHAKWYPQRQFDWVHLETQIRPTMHAELMVGLALLITQSLGHEPQSGRAVTARRAHPLPRDLSGLHDRRRGDRLHHAGWAIQAEQHLHRLRPRSLSREPARDGQSADRLLRARRRHPADQARAGRPLHRAQARAGASRAPRSAPGTGSRSSGRSASGTSPSGVLGTRCSRSSTERPST